MNKLFNRLFVKIFLSFWLILVITAALSIGISRLTSSEYMAAPNWAIKSLNHFAQKIEQNPHLIEADRLPKKTRRFGHPFIMSLDGAMLNPQPIHKEMRRFIANHDQLNNPQLGFHHQFVMMGPVTVNISGQAHLLYLERRMSEQEQHRLMIRNSSPWLLASMAVLFSLGLCFLLARHIVGPLKQVQQAANTISLGDLNTELPILKRGDEIGQLNHSLQRMLSTLNQAISNQQRLLSDISHELRSPLTRLNMALAIHKKRQGDSPELLRIAKEAERLEAMIAALLSLSRMQVNAEQQNFNLSELLAELVSDVQFEAQQLDKQFTATYPEALALNGYPQLLVSAIENVCRNALRYAKQRVELTISIEEQQLRLSIRDDGAGLPEAELNQIFRPFYRSDEARDRSSGGVGLGLAISESALRQHGGSISAHNLPDSGLEVTLCLPLK